jgi:putative transposase
VDRAYDAFFKRRSRFPRLRSKKAGHFTFRIPQRVRVEDGRVYVPKIGWVRIRLSRGVEGTTKSATFKRDACGHWYVALSTEFEIPDVEPPAPVNPVGVDLGLKDLFVLSDGERFPAPRFARTADRRLGRSQRGLSRKKPGSRRREKAKRRGWAGRRDGSTALRLRNSPPRESASAATATSSSATVRTVANFFCIIYLPSSRNEGLSG